MSDQENIRKEEERPAAEVVPLTEEEMDRVAGGCGGDGDMSFAF